MKLICERAPLVQALARLSRLVERKTTIPILSNIMIEAKGGSIVLVSTDLDMEARATISADISKEGKTTLPADTFYSIVRKFPDGAQISMESKDKNNLQVSSGRSRFTLPMLPASDFPDFNATDFPTSFNINAKELFKLIDLVDFAISTEETRYYLNGIYFHHIANNDNPSLRAVATDGHRLARYDMSPPEGCVGFPGIIIPRKACTEFKKLASEIDGDLTLELSDKKIRLSNSNVAIASKTVEGTFPDYNRVIPFGNDKFVRADRDALAAAVDRVSCVGTERGRGIKLAFDKQELKLSVRSDEHGAAEESIEIDYEGPPIEIGFNHRYVLDMLSAFASDHCLIQLADPGSPALLAEREGAPFVGVLMPMRV